MTDHERAPGWSEIIMRRPAAADAAVAQPVEHQGEQPAGGGDLGDVAPAAVGDAVTVGAQLEVGGQTLDRLDRGPADQPGT